jgi:hypothetical protein
VEFPAGCFEDFKKNGKPLLEIGYPDSPLGLDGAGQIRERPKAWEKMV